MVSYILFTDIIMQCILDTTVWRDVAAGNDAEQCELLSVAAVATIISNASADDCRRLTWILQHFYLFRSYVFSVFLVSDGDFFFRLYFIVALHNKP